MQSSSSMNGKERTMIDELKYSYTELTLPNIVARWEKGDSLKENSVPTFEVDSDIKPFVEALAMKYPQWRFVCSSYWRHRRGDDEPVHAARRFNVYNGREVLGEISTDSMRNGMVYTIYNERIERSRSRGRVTKTKDLNKAVKIVGKMFGSKTIEERMLGVMEEGGSIVSQVYRDRWYKFDSTYSDITSKLVPYVIANWDVISEEALKQNVDPNIVSSFTEKYNEHQAMKGIQECLAKSAGVAVLIHGKDYAVTKINASVSDETTLYTTETLPPHIKLAIGMLKLLEPKNFIGGVGVKISDESFFVIKEEA